MKIGITCYPTYGGSGVVATELGLELAARGYDVHFISYAPPIRLNSTSDRIQFHEVEVSSYPLFDHPPYARSEERRVGKECRSRENASRKMTKMKNCRWQ